MTEPAGVPPSEDDSVTTQTECVARHAAGITPVEKVCFFKGVYFLSNFYQ